MRERLWEGGEEIHYKLRRLQGLIGILCARLSAGLLGLDSASLFLSLEERGYVCSIRLTCMEVDDTDVILATA